MLLSGNFPEAPRQSQSRREEGEPEAMDLLLEKGGWVIEEGHESWIKLKADFSI